VAHAAPIRSIAVLPLALRSADSTQEYFAEGMTDELTAAVATISALRVTSRGSAMQFQGKSRPATSVIAKTLNVDAIVEGSVAREGEKVRITANLIDARADSTIWTMTLTRNSNDVLASRPPWRRDRQSDKVQLTRARSPLRERTDRQLGSTRRLSPRPILLQSAER
jgi:TolB-like protein